MQVFCLGTFLALSAQIVVTHYEESIVSQISVSLAGIATMCMIAYAATWLKGNSTRESLA